MKEFLFVLGASVSLLACSEPKTDVGADAMEAEADALEAGGALSEGIPETAAAPKDRAECDKAKEAAVAARTKYDRDYEARNPGMVSMSLSPDELTTCRLVDSGAFLGKWGGQRWRYVPKSDGAYARDPKRVWIGQDEGLDDLSWFSEWRSEGASVAKNEELNSKLKSARNIYG